MTAALDRLERLLAQATPGPWHVTDCRHQKSGQLRVFGLREQIANVLAAGRNPSDDAALIVALRNAAPELIQAVRTLEEIGKCCSTHSGADGQPVLLATLYRVSGEAEDALAALERVLP